MDGWVAGAHSFLLWGEPGRRWVGGSEEWVGLFSCAVRLWPFETETRSAEGLKPISFGCCRRGKSRAPSRQFSFFASCSAVPKMGQDEYFGVNREPNRMDERVAGAQASCSGVNLAVAGSGARRSGFGLFSCAVRLWPFETETGSGIFKTETRSGISLLRRFCCRGLAARLQRCCCRRRSGRCCRSWPRGLRCRPERWARAGALWRT
jgi:hypothetical protein